MKITVASFNLENLFNHYALLDRPGRTGITNEYAETNSTWAEDVYDNI